MKGLIFYAPKDIRVEDLPEPVPGEGEVLLRVLYASICFTDKVTYEGLWGTDRAGIVLGHEGSGEVQSVGPGVTELKVGDRVAVDPFLGCGQCVACRAGYKRNCLNRKRLGMGTTMGASAVDSRGKPVNGLMAEYCVAPAYNCYRLPETVSDLAGVATEPFAVGVRAARWSGVAPGDSVVIFGLDDFALGLLQQVKMSHRFVFDAVEKRRTIALKYGAEEVYDPREVKPSAIVLARYPWGVDRVYVSMEDQIPESRDYTAEAYKLPMIHGEVGFLRYQSFEPGRGLGGGGFPRTTEREITVRQFGIFCGDEPWRGGKARSDYQVVIDQLAEGKLDGTSHVTRIVEFDDVKNSADVDEIFHGMPYDQYKISFRIWGRKEGQVGLSSDRARGKRAKQA